MKRSLFITIAVLSLALAVTTPASSGGLTLPGRSHAFGASLSTWQKRWMRWAFGSSTNPLASDVCGEKIGGVYFLNVAGGPGIKEVDCRIPPGTRLLGIVGGAIAWAPTDGETPEQLLAARDSFMSSVSDVRATLDGRALRVNDAALRSTGVYTMRLEPGNLIQNEDDGVLGDETQVASGGWFLRLKPLTPGRHELVFSDLIDGVGVFEIQFHITVPKPKP